MCLQQRTQNIVTAVQMIETIKEDLKKYINDDDYWEELLGVVTAFCIKNDIFVPNMQDPLPGRARLYRSVDRQPKTYYHFFVETSFLRSYWISSYDRAHLLSQDSDQDSQL
ncbi:hypothetical protein M9H77_04622 [Catharanthus roseus]|uniref:Uncharacterized protein n=1 Tax=Catharanthus roseus TaxID=4058 RepID=A0ACC0CET8_CATRO|nr:hypothetical protein M9H77_04622 [Catharanthus roseus]